MAEKQQKRMENIQARNNAKKNKVNFINNFYFKFFSNFFSYSNLLILVTFSSLKFRKRISERNKCNRVRIVYL